MKAWKYLGLLALTGAIMGACSTETTDNDDGGTTAGTGGSGGATATSVTSSTTSTVTTGVGGSGGASGICMSSVEFDGDVFDGCLNANCCAQFDPCLADTDCATCLQNGAGAPGCDTNTLYQSFIGCFDDNCAASVCDTTLAYQSPNFNTCINDNCCSTFTPCEADMACAACLGDPEGVGCDTNTLFQAYTTCRDASCPADICGTNIIFVTTYYNMSQDVNYDSVLCAQDNCCQDLTECADPSMNGYLEMNDPEVDACLLCLQGDPQCMAGAVSDAADAFNACFSQNCP